MSLSLSFSDWSNGYPSRRKAVQAAFDRSYQINKAADPTEGERLDIDDEDAVLDIADQDASLLTVVKMTDDRARQIVRDLARQDIASGDEREPSEQISAWRGSAMDAGDFAVVDAIDCLGDQAAEIYSYEYNWRLGTVGRTAEGDVDMSDRITVIPSELCEAYDSTVEIPGDQEQVADLRREAEVSNYPRVVLTSWARGHEAPSFAACDRWNEPVTVSMLPPPFVESLGGAIGIISLT